MALEPYDPCPCGTGKKFKFCCQPIFEDLQAIDRLLGERQPRQALVAAEKLEPRHSENALLMRSKILANLMLGNNQEAHDLIQAFEKAHPENPFGYYFDIRWNLQFGTWEKARPLIEAHLTSIANQAPGMASNLCLEIVDEQLHNGSFMSVWRYLFDALVLAQSQEDQQAILSTMSDLRMATDIPLPFRHFYALKKLPENQPNEAEFAEAMKYAMSRDWTNAAQRFEALSVRDPHQPVLTYNAGLCYSWAGDLAAAAELLGRAADDLPDFESAVQYETLAQLHEQQLPDEQIPRNDYRYRAKSVSRLLTQLDQEPRLYRQEQQADVSAFDRPVAATYLLLNHPRSEFDPARPETALLALASIVILDEVREPELAAEMLVRSMSADYSEADHNILLAAAGEQIEQPEGETWGKLEGLPGMPRYLSSLNFHVVPAADMGRTAYLKLFADHARHVVEDEWTKLPLTALDGRTPVEAAQDPDLHLPVCAAINVLAHYAEMANYPLDVGRLREKLGLPAIELKTFASLAESREANIQDIMRVNFTDAAEDVLKESFSMLAGTRAVFPLRRLLEAMYTRGITLPNFDAASICRMAAGLAIRVLDLDNAQMWIERGRTEAQKKSGELMTRLEWDLSSLESLVMIGDQARIVELLRKIAREYFHKIPECKPEIQRLLSVERLDTPEIRSILDGTDLQSGGAGSSGGLWTPETAGAAPAGKLWVPGQ